MTAGIRCAIDVSDGLLQDLGHVCRASRLGALVRREKLPIDPALSELFEPEEALRYAVAGGEDYELLFAGSREQITELSRRIDLPVTIVGEMVAAAKYRAKLLDESGEEIEISATGWDHLREQG